MPQAPLSEAVVAVLQSDPTAALGALMVIAGAHAELFGWVTGVVFGEEPEQEPRRRRKRRKTKANGATGKDPYLDRRRAQRDADDQALLKAMRSNREGSIADWATMIGKSRTSCVSGLHRLRAAGLAESVGGWWALVKQEEPREPAPKWIEPLSAAREHRAHV
jgi:hypothetical protein